MFVMVGSFFVEGEMVVVEVIFFQSEGGYAVEGFV